ncbi:MAG: zinc-binding dehydrogenase [Candidatus Heimdallarchaeota archaeon]|nr:zinc-binding dehydrogenase [Candidatus Heimdallarchaeota archaeon]
MKAAVVKEHGGLDVLEITEVDKPTISENEVLIQVKSIALNRLDIWVRRGLPTLKLEFPHVGASDFAGVISEVGGDVKNLNVGDRVVVNAGISCRRCYECRSGEQSLCGNFHLLGEHVWGGAAEFARVPASNILKIPDNITFTTAAASSLTALTVYRMLVTQAVVRPGQIVLVTGGGGGIGTMAVQMANALGARVIALTSTLEKENKLRELGAELVINYREDEGWSKTIYGYTGKRGVDIVVDSVGEVFWEQALRSLKKGGKLVTCGATSGFGGKTNIGLVFWKQLSILGSTMSTDKEFKEALSMVFSGKITPVIDSVLPLEQIKDAHEKLESGNVMGKVVLTID